MKKSILSFFLFGAILSAAPVNVTFVDAGNPLQAAYGDYVGPYDLKVNGVKVKAMCMDDFLTVGGSWKANTTLVSSVNFSKTYLGNTSFSIYGQAFTSNDIYSAEAYLFSKLIAPSADRASLQEAAWAITDDKTLAKVFATNNTNVQNILQDVFTNYKGFDTTGYEILSDTADCNRNQEFMIKTTPASATPEPATFALMGGGLLAAGAARFFRRKKNAEVKN